MRYLGIDYGAKRLGLALSDERGHIAFPKDTVPNDATAIDRIRAITSRESVKKIIFGDTRTVSGSDNVITAQATRFAEALSKHTGIPVEYMWEAWSSIEAARFAPKGKEHDDSAAAAIILQRYIDTHPES